MLETLPPGAAQLAARCEAAPQCVGFIASDHGGATLAPCEPQPWLPYHCGNASTFACRPPSAAAASTFDGVLCDVGGGRLDAYPPPFASSHASMIEQDASGRLHMAWFSGTGEGHSNVSTVYTQLSATDYTAAGAKWPAAAMSCRAAGYSNQNAVLYCNGSSLHLFHSQQPAEKGEDNATVWHLVAPIDAATGHAAFSAPRELFSAPGSYDKNRVLERLDGSWLLPLYDSRVNSPFNAFLPRGADAGVSAQWEPRGMAAAATSTSSSRRSCGSETRRVCSPIFATPTRHIGRQRRATTARAGRLRADAAPEQRRRHRAVGDALRRARARVQPADQGARSAALISDDGETWAAQRTLEHEDGRQEFSYPTLREDVQRDGIIHVSYVEAATIKHSVVSEADPRDVADLTITYSVCYVLPSAAPSAPLGDDLARHVRVGVREDEEAALLWRHRRHHARRLRDRLEEHGLAAGGAVGEVEDEGRRAAAVVGARQVDVRRQPPASA